MVTYTLICIHSINVVFQFLLINIYLSHVYFFHIKPPIPHQDSLKDELSDGGHNIAAGNSDGIKQQLLQIFPNESSQQIERAILKNNWNLAINYLLDTDYTNEEDDSGKYYSCLIVKGTTNNSARIY